MLTKNLITAIATGTVLVSSFTPMAFADSSMYVTGNGALSNNTANVTTTQSQQVVQNNNATVTNSIHSDANTGQNRANDNTGGNAAISTGNAGSSLQVVNKANMNQAMLGSMGTGTNGGANIALSGNGYGSANNGTTTDTNATSAFQGNTANFNNDIWNTAKTGANNTNDNTGGSSSILTGSAQNQTAVYNAANANTAQVGGGNNMINTGTGFGSGAEVIGNGANSGNTATLNMTNAATAVQNNDAMIVNQVQSNAMTGENTGNNSTGGFFGFGGTTSGNTGAGTIETGSAFNQTGVQNMANFNVANVGCGCDMTVFGKIGGNGADSSSSLTGNTANTMSVFQGGDNGNRANLQNIITPTAQSGQNELSNSTQGMFGDPSILSGTSYSDTSVSNSTNANTYSSSNTGFAGLPINFTFSWNSLFGGM